MAKCSLFYIIAIGLLLAGCVSMPDLHGTAGHYNESGDIDTECFTTGRISARNTSAATQEITELNSRNFKVLNWNSYKGRDTIWLKDLERLSSQSDLVVLQEEYLTDDVAENKEKTSFLKDKLWWLLLSFVLVCLTIMFILLKK